MTVAEFLQFAESAICNNPQERLPKDIKNTFSALPHDVDKMIFDVYAQCFTKAHLPQGFRRPGWFDRFYPGTMAQAWWFSIISYLKKRINIKGFDSYSGLWQRFLIEYYSAIYKTSDGILVHQFDQYNDAFEQKLLKPRPHIFICTQMMDMERGIESKIEKPFYEQWKELSELRIHHNKAILPFLALDPRNPSIYEDFLAAFSEPVRRINLTGQAFLDKAFPFFGVHLYPSLGYMPSDPVLMPIFKVCAEKKIPVTAHCGSAGIWFSGNMVKGQHLILQQGKWVFSDYKFICSPAKKASQERAIARFFNAPANWIAVLEAFPDLKLNLSHFGGQEAWWREKVKSPSPVEETLRMLVQYPNVYADITTAITSKQNLNTLSGALYNSGFSPAQRDVFRTKFLFGSNYYHAQNGLINTTVNFFRHFKQDKPMLNQLCIHNPIRFLLE